MRIENEDYCWSTTASGLRSNPITVKRTGIESLYRLNRARHIAILSICCWSLMELPHRFDINAGLTGFFALLVSRLIWLVGGGAAMLGGSQARAVFLVLCAASAVAIVRDLPSAYAASSVGFLFLMVGGLLKASLLGITLASHITKRTM